MKILRALLEEPRTSFAKIARDCRLSTPSIYNRFELLRKSGIINGSVMQIDPKSLGYTCVCMASIQADPKDKKKISDFFESENIPFYDQYLTGSGLLCFVVSKNMDELAKLSKKIKDHSSIRDISTLIWVNTTNIDHPENLIIPKISVHFSPTEVDTKKENSTNPLKSPKVQVSSEELKKINSFTQLDNIDLALARILTNNARISFRKLAGMLGVSTNNVINRYKKLRKTVLKCSSITLNLEKLGYVGSGVMKLKVKDGFSVQEIYDKLLQIPNVIIGIQIYGDCDLLIIAPFRAFDELESLTQKVTNVSGVCNITLTIDKPFTKWPLNKVSDTILIDLFGPLDLHFL